LRKAPFKGIGCSLIEKPSKNEGKNSHIKIHGNITYLAWAAQRLWGTISRVERAKKNFDPHLRLTWEDMKQDIAVIFTAIMTSDLD